MKRYHIRTLFDIREIFKKEDVMIFGLGGFPSTRSEIWKIIPYFEVITLNKTGEFNSVKEKIPLKFFSINKEKIIKKPEELLNKLAVQAYIKKRAGGKRVGIYIYKSTQKIDLICKKNNWELIANKSSIFKKVSSKKTFFKILSSINYKRDFKILKFPQLEKSIDNLFAQFGERIVIQLLNEGGGRGTLFFDSKEASRVQEKIKERLELIKNKEKLEDMELVISPFINGPALSIMGCVTRDNGTLPLYAQYQLIDIPEVTGQKKDVQGGFCGHDWSLSRKIPPAIHEEARKLVIEIGKKLKEMGHLGIFGLDFMIDGKTGKIFPLEINPRLLGSFPTIVYVQYQKKEIPLVAFHLLDFLNIKYKIDSEKIYRKGSARNGAHIILFNPKNCDVKCNNELSGGVYKLSGNNLKFIRQGFDLSDIKSKNEFILTEGAPIINKIYKKNRKILKILTAQSISTDKGKKLKKFGKDIIFQVYKKLNLTHYE